MHRLDLSLYSHPKEFSLHLNNTSYACEIMLLCVSLAVVYTVFNLEKANKCKGIGLSCVWVVLSCA